ncbi:MAG: amidohydrolase family protein [Desulfobacterales bacterium]
MIIDFHTHIFPKDICENREKYFHGEPAFKLIYDSPNSKLVGADNLINAMDENQVDLSVAFGFPWRNPDTTRLCNDYTVESVKKYPKRLKGLCCLDPFFIDAAEETTRCIENGLSGVGELAFYQSGIEPDALDHLAPVMEICRKKNMPVLIHTNEPIGHSYPGKTPNTLKQIYEIPLRFPDNKIVLAHWGGGLFFFTLLKREVRQAMKNVYYDTAASPFLYDPKIYNLAADLVGEDRILFGSDYPLLQPLRYFKEMESATIPEKTKKGIFGNNAASLLKI